MRRPRATGSCRPRPRGVRRPGDRLRWERRRRGGGLVLVVPRVVVGRGGVGGAGPRLGSAGRRGVRAGRRGRGDHPGAAGPGRRAGRIGRRGHADHPGGVRGRGRGHPARLRRLRRHRGAERDAATGATVEVLVRGGPTKDTVGQLEEAAARCPQAQITSPAIGSATITFESRPTSPTWATAPPLLRYTTAVALPDGTQATVPALIGAVRGRRPGADPDEPRHRRRRRSRGGPRRPGGLRRPARSRPTRRRRRRSTDAVTAAPAQGPTSGLGVHSRGARPQILRGALARPPARQGFGHGRPRRPPRSDPSPSGSPTPVSSRRRSRTCSASGRPSRSCCSAWPASAVAGSG